MQCLTSCGFSFLSSFGRECEKNVLLSTDRLFCLSSSDVREKRVGGTGSTHDHEITQRKVEMMDGEGGLFRFFSLDGWR